MNLLKSYLFMLSRRQKRVVMICADLLLIASAVWVSFAIRLGSSTPQVGDGIWLILAAPLITIPIFFYLDLYRAVIRFLGNQVLGALLMGVSISAVGLVLVTALLQLEDVPRSFYVIYLGVTLLFVGGARYMARYFYHATSNKAHCLNIAIYGVGSAGVQLVRSLYNSLEFRPILFIDDNIQLQRSIVHGLKVYSLDELPDLLSIYQIKQILLAIPSVKQNRRHEILQKLEPLPIHVRTIPSLDDLVSGRSITEIHEIEIDDLLGRKPVTPHIDLLARNIRMKKVMVTGAGGSIGSELCRQIILQQPVQLVLFESSEFALYQIERELLGLCGHEVAIIPVIGSVQNQKRIEYALQKYDIETVYHAAAYKHVPLVEHNPIEGAQNNILGTWLTASASQKVGVEHFVLISTDKAVRPTNVMGATKRMAELGLQALARNRAGKTIFSMVRFGNVLGSSGSVVPLFRKQIRQGGPVTVTHADIIRYFMTIPEAAQLVIQAGAMAKGGEVFLLDMGEPVKILDLAKRMIRLSGLQECSKQNPNGDICIEFTGLRPGEKLYEELLIEGDAEPTEHGRIYQALEESVDLETYKRIVDSVTVACEENNLERLLSILESYVSGYQSKMSTSSMVEERINQIRVDEIKKPKKCEHV